MLLLSIRVPPPSLALVQTMSSFNDALPGAGHIPPTSQQEGCSKSRLSKTDSNLVKGTWLDGNISGHYVLLERLPPIAPCVVIGPDELDLLSPTKLPRMHHQVIIPLGASQLTTLRATPFEP